MHLPDVEKELELSPHSKQVLKGKHHNSRKVMFILHVHCRNQTVNSYIKQTPKAWHIFLLKLFTYLSLHCIIKILKCPKIFVLYIFRCLNILFSNCFLKELKDGHWVYQEIITSSFLVRMKEDLRFSLHNCLYLPDCNKSFKYFFLSLL